MNQIILASHGPLAQGMKESVEFFTGPTSIICLIQTKEESNFQQKMEKTLSSCSGHRIIVFTDLIGGSVNQMFTRALDKYEFLLVSSMNLGLILECVFQQEDVDASMLQEMIDKAKSQCMLMNVWVNQQQQEEREE